MSGSRRLIVNADDFGRSPGINAAILKSHVEGIVTSTTLMVNMPWADDAVAAARAAPALALGLHLNFCYGEPVSAHERIPSLVDEHGRFRTDTSKLAALAMATDIRVETNAQIARFRKLVGRGPTHLDSHKYLHSTPRLVPVIAPIAAEAGLPVRATGAEDRAILRRAGVLTPDTFEGRFHGLDGDGVDVALLVGIIHDLSDGVTELMCHPGIVDEHILDSSYSSDRERELAALCAPKVSRAVHARRITLTSFEALGRPG